jgi:hypothetical protein
MHNALPTSSSPSIPLVKSEFQKSGAASSIPRRGETRRDEARRGETRRTSRLMQYEDR